MPVEPDPCGSTPLGIGQEAREPFPDQNWFPPSSDTTVWRWNILDDTLTLRFSGICPADCGISRHMKFVINDCITLVRDYERVLAWTGSLANPFQESITDFEVNFQLQYWNEQSTLVGKNNDTEIWVDFNQDNRY